MGKCNVLFIFLIGLVLSACSDLNVDTNKTGRTVVSIPCMHDGKIDKLGIVFQREPSVKLKEYYLDVPYLTLGSCFNSKYYVLRDVYHNQIVIQGDKKDGAFSPLDGYEVICPRDKNVQFIMLGDTCVKVYESDVENLLTYLEHCKPDGQRA